MAGVCNETDTGKAGLLTADEVAGARAWGEAMERGDEESEADISKLNEVIWRILVFAVEGCESANGLSGLL